MPRFEIISPVVKRDQFLRNLNTSAPATFKVGFDPEVFVRDLASGRVIPGFEIRPGRKLSPAAALGPTDVYPDGFALEFATEPRTCLAFATDATQTGLRLAARAAEKVGGELSLVDVVHIPNLRDYRPQQIALGCSPSENAYDTRAELPEDPYELPFRTIGCHIHFGRREATSEALYPEAVQPIVQALDFVVGPVMTSLLAGLEDPLRRTVYGRAGEFRYKPYGFEYRVPSAAIMWHPVVFNIVVNLARNVVALMQVHHTNVHLYGTDTTSAAVFASLRTIVADGGLLRLPDSDTIREFSDTVVNHLDVAAAHAHLKENQELYEHLLGSILSGINRAYPVRVGHHENMPLSVPSNSQLFEFVLGGAKRGITCTHQGLLDAWRINPDQRRAYPDPDATLATWRNYMEHANWPEGCVTYSMPLIKRAEASVAASRS